MDMRITEPFSWGYIHAGREDKGYRTAFGMKTFSEVVELEINTEEWFQSPVGKFSSLAVHYSRGDGIELNESVRNKNAEKLTELKELEELNFYYDYFRPYETTRIISKVRTPLQEKLSVLSKYIAAGCLIICFIVTVEINFIHRESCFYSEICTDFYSR